MPSTAIHRVREVRLDIRSLLLPESMRVILVAEGASEARKGEPCTDSKLANNMRGQRRGAHHTSLRKEQSSLSAPGPQEEGAGGRPQACGTGRSWRARPEGGAGPDQGITPFRLSRNNQMQPGRPLRGCQPFPTHPDRTRLPSSPGRLPACRPL